MMKSEAVRIFCKRVLTLMCRCLSYNQSNSPRDPLINKGSRACCCLIFKQTFLHPIVNRQETGMFQSLFDQM